MNLILLIRYWSEALPEEGADNSVYYITVYAVITPIGLVVSTVCWFVLYNGSIHALTVLYERLLEMVLFANICFHDTVSRGQLLNQFEKDFEGMGDEIFLKTPKSSNLIR